MTGHGSLGGWQDIHRMADVIERANQIIGDIPLGDIPKDTMTGVTNGHCLTIAYVAVLKQAAREQAATRLAAGLARMDPDKRREHANDARAEQLDDMWDADTGRAS